MNVLIIPEDFRKDQYILKPIISSMLKHLGKPNANVRVCVDPLLGGVSEALRWQKINEIIERYKGLIDLFLLCVDRDGDTNRINKLISIENQAATILPQKKMLFGEVAWQELEVWLLAGHTLPSGWDWQEIRSDLNPKENFFEPFAKIQGTLKEPAQGRPNLGRIAATHYNRIRSMCLEDVQNLESRIEAWLTTKP